MDRKYLLPAALIGSLFAGNALADQKEISPAVCQPYTDTTLNPALLRIREDGITNNYAVAKSVICPLPKDTETNWDPNYDTHIKVTFHRNGGSPLSANKCTLTVGYSANPPVTSTTRSVGVNNLTDGWLVFSGNDLYNASPESPATLVCNIAPGNTLSFIYMYEEEATD